MDFSGAETLILNRIQRDFPVSADPYADIAGELSMNEEDFLVVTRGLKSKGVLRNISGIFNASKLGYVSTLVAFCVDDRKIEQAAGAVNAHPGVSHNYLRNHAYNLWFTIAADSEKKLERTIEILAEQAGAIDRLILKNEALLKIGVVLPIGGSAENESDGPTVDTAVHDNQSGTVTDEDKTCIRLLQMDLPLEKAPFSKLINLNNVPIDVDYLVNCMLRLKQRGIMRRYSAVLRHRHAGYTANAMTAWKMRPEDDRERLRKIFAGRGAISHLYIRTIHPGRWEYPLFAMIHARNDDELDAIITGLSKESGITDFQVLRTVKEFKKERVTYFSDTFSEWETQAGL